MTLLSIVERHLRAAALAPSRFGRDVAGDPRFVFDLRRGREPRPAMAARVRAAIAAASDAAPLPRADFRSGSDDSAAAPHRGSISRIVTIATVGGEEVRCDR
jgi:hypothetical protein